MVMVPLICWPRAQCLQNELEMAKVPCMDACQLVSAASEFLRCECGGVVTT